MLRSGIGAHHHVVGFLADRAGIFPPCCFTNSPASSRLRFAIPPVNTKDFPANLSLFISRFSAVGCTPAFSSFLISWRFAGSEKNSHDAGGHLRPYLSHFFQLRLGRRQILQRRKMLGQQLPRALAHETECPARKSAAIASFSCSLRFRRAGSARTSPPSVPARPVRPISGNTSPRDPSRYPLSTSWSTILSPSPSIFIACRPAKCSSDSLRFAGHADVHAAIRHRLPALMNRAPALRAILRHAERPPVLAFLHHFQHVRNHFARAFNQHRIADLDAQPLHFVHVVQRRAAHRNAANLHRLQQRPPASASRFGRRSPEYLSRLWFPAAPDI